MIAGLNPQCVIGQDQWKKLNKLFLEILHWQHSHVRWVEKVVSLIVVQIGSSDSQTNNWLYIEKLNFLCKPYQNNSSYKEIFKDWSSKSGSRPVTETLRRKFNSVSIEETYYLLIYLSSTLALDQYRAFANNSKYFHFEAIYKQFTAWHILYHWHLLVQRNRQNENKMKICEIWTMCEICSVLTKMTLEQRQSRRSVFIINFQTPKNIN